MNATYLRWYANARKFDATPCFPPVQPRDLRDGLEWRLIEVLIYTNLCDGKYGEIFDREVGGLLCSGRSAG
jgi:hypothetical protein